MATLNLLQLAAEYGNQWVVLNRNWIVVDSGDELAALRARNEPGRPFTYFFVSA